MKEGNSGRRRGKQECTRSILSRVPFFEAALASGFQEGDHARVEIRDAGVAAFRAVWHYLYTDDCARVTTLVTAEVLDVLSLAKRFELPVVALACSRRLVELVPAMPAGTLVEVFRTALLHELHALRDACHDRVGEVGADFLLEDGVWEALLADGVLRAAVVRASAKRRRTI